MLTFCINPTAFCVGTIYMNTMMTQVTVLSPLIVTAMNTT